MLQRLAVRCSVLQCVAVCCSVQNDAPRVAGDLVDMAGVGYFLSTPSFMFTTTQSTNVLGCRGI